MSTEIDFVRVCRTAKLVVVHWVDGHLSRFPWRWLRYECGCDECGSSHTGIRFVTLPELPADLKAEEAVINTEGALEIQWSPQSHRSRFAAEWLRQHCLDEAERASRRHLPTTWDSTLSSSLPSTCFDAFMGDAGARCDVLESLRDFGIAHLSDGPVELGTVEQIATKLGPLEETNFGRLFDLQARVDAKAIGATRHPATLHTDEPYRNMPTGIKVLHCLQAADPGGGYSLFVDGFRLAEQLQSEQSSAFDLLCETPIAFNRRYDDAIVMACAPVFSCDREGRVVGFRFQDRSMAPLSAQVSAVDSIYDAIVELMARIGDPKNQLKLRLEAGEAILFDNQRVLHGRTGFTGSRHIQLCSVNRDTFISTLRVLQRDLGRAGPFLEIAGGAFA